MQKTGERDPEAARERLGIILGLMVDEGVKENGIGYMTPKKMAETHDIILKTAGIAESLPVGDLYSNAFLPGIRLRRP